MCILVQLGDLLIHDEKYDFKPFQLNAGGEAFPGMGITYLDTENMPVLLLPGSVSVKLRSALMSFAIYYYCSDPKGQEFDKSLMHSTLIHSRDFVNIMYTMDSIYVKDGVWRLNDTLENVVVLGKDEDWIGLTEEDITEGLSELEEVQ